MNAHVPTNCKPHRVTRRYVCRHVCIRYDEWQKTYAEWKEENPEKAKMLQDGIDHKIPSVDELMEAIPEFDQDTDIATRIAGQMVLQVCFAYLLFCCCATLCW